jgi:hypothetical protein
MIPIKYKYPNWLNEIAQHIAINRINNNKELNKKYEKYVRPDEYNIIGALGELIFLVYLTTKEVNYESNILFGNVPVIGYDVKIDNKYFIDIKTTSKSFLSVNKESHHKENKEITHYVFIKLNENNFCDIYKFNKNEIENWEIGKKIRTTGTSEFYLYKL